MLTIEQLCALIDDSTASADLRLSSNILRIVAAHFTEQTAILDRLERLIQLGFDVKVERMVVVDPYDGPPPAQATRGATPDGPCGSPEARAALEAALAEVKAEVLARPT